MIRLFKGCAPSPLAAIVRVYKFERNSVYIDTYYLSHPVNLFYGIYVDDMGSLASSHEEARELLNTISDQDPDKLLHWEEDYPDNEKFIPFLDTSIKIDNHGILHHKYYRKPQKKDITLNWNSHHPMGTKIETAKNFHKTATTCSSHPEYLTESLNRVDQLLAHNDYPTTGKPLHPRNLHATPIPPPHLPS